MSTPETPTTSSLGPAILCAGTSAVFVALAGAFLVGALSIVSPAMMTIQAVDPNQPLNDGQQFLLLVLSVAAGVCFLVAIGALALAYRKLP